MAEPLDEQKTLEFQKAINSVIQNFYPNGAVEEVKISFSGDNSSNNFRACQWKCWTTPAGNTVCGWVC